MRLPPEDELTFDEESMARLVKQMAKMTGGQYGWEQLMKENSVAAKLMRCKKCDKNGNPYTEYNSGNDENDEDEYRESVSDMDEQLGRVLVDWGINEPGEKPSFKIKIKPKHQPPPRIMVVCMDDAGLQDHFVKNGVYEAKKAMDADMLIVIDVNGKDVECLKERFSVIEESDSDA